MSQRNPKRLVGVLAVFLFSSSFVLAEPAFLRAPQASIQRFESPENAQSQYCEETATCPDGRQVHCAAEGPEVYCSREEYSVYCKNYGTGHEWEYSCY